MRLVHLSDIHLSKDNYNEFKNNYIDALLKDLAVYNNSITIDLIVITGDLVDKGGHSLFEILEFKDYKSPYDIFEEVFINPISKLLGIDKHKFLFIPGNHDIDEKGILLFDEKELLEDINHHNINKYLLENKTFKHSNRIRKFKEFEENYHNENPNYTYSPNQSTYIYEDKKNDCKVGFILVNDSWRCKSIKLAIENDEKHYFGIQQLHDGLKALNEINTQLNICLVHHALEDYKESEDVKGILNRINIELFLHGHLHSAETKFLYTPYGNCKGFRARAALFKPQETDCQYHPGYQILDFNLITYKITAVHYRKYNYKNDSKAFISDNETAPDNGVDKNKANSNLGFDLPREGREAKKLNLNKDQFK